MSKELNIIELVNMPVGTEAVDGTEETANHVKVFCNEEDGISYLKVRRNDLDNSFHSFKWVEPIMDKLWLNSKFTIIQKPVLFMEAIKSGKDKDVKVDFSMLKFYNEEYYSYLNNKYKTFSDTMYDLAEEFESEELINIILNGEWYVEEN